MMKSLRCNPRILCVHHATFTRPHSVTMRGWCPSSSAISPTLCENSNAPAKSENLNVRSSRLISSTSVSSQSGTTG